MCVILPSVGAALGDLQATLTQLTQQFVFHHTSCEQLGHGLLLEEQLKHAARQVVTSEVKGQQAEPLRKPLTADTFYSVSEAS